MTLVLSTYGSATSSFRFSLATLVALIALSPCSRAPLWGQEKSASIADKEIQWFETHVRPILVKHCYECHSGEAQKGSLSLDSRIGVFEGGDSGPAVLPGEPDESPLIEAVRYEGLEMPPNEKLPEAAIQRLVEWVQRGAAWPEDQDTEHIRRPARIEVSDADREHWAFRPIEAPPLPEADSKPNPIDVLVDQRLHQEGIVPNPPTTTRVLVRRLFLGLTGLPPTYQQLESWVERLGDEQASSIDEEELVGLINHLLQEPSYGEHWARHWLDVVRFAQSNGYERDGFKPYSWRYRDYVIRSFQNDKPYDRFVLEQLAGDELADSDNDSRIATGFYRLGVWDDEPDDARQAEFDELDDVMVTIGASLMGLTIGCARCHDHKFDAIPQSDYYRLLAHLRNIRRYANPQDSLDSATTLPIGDAADLLQAQIDFLDRQQTREAAIGAAEDDEQRKALEAEPLDQTLPGCEWTLGVREHSGEPPVTQVLIRGDAGTPGSEVQPGFPLVLVPPTEEAEPGRLDSSEHESAASQYRSESPLQSMLPSSGRRLALARWLTDPKHPLTARVIVNRVWHYHFGRGIVETTGDFGKAGSLPSHPDLLDWLADDFIQHGWSIKHLHRRILTSQVYRRSSQIDMGLAEHQVATQKDPGNRLLWRASLRRLEAEVIRDRMLLSSGELNVTIGGPEMYPQLSGEVLAGQSKPGLGWKPSPPEQRARRSLYAIVKRGVRDPLLEAFDYSNVTSPLTERPTTTVSPQALLMLHGRFTAERSQFLADRIVERHADPDAQVTTMFLEILQRLPTDHEMQFAIDTLRSFQSEYRRTADHIVFRPDVPVSLFGEYRRALAGNQFLLGPKESWNYFRGTWGGGYEGIDVVEPRQGPFAMWQGGSWDDGVLEGRLRVDAAVEYLTLIGRGRTQGDQWMGIGLTFDRALGNLEGREQFANRSEESDHGQDEVLTVPFELPANRWISFRWQLAGQHSRIWMDDPGSGRPALEQVVNDFRSESGLLGVAVWGGQVEFDGLKWTPASSDTSIDIANARVSIQQQDLPSGWSRYDGDWRRESDGSWHVSASQGAKILWDDQPAADGDVQVEMKLSSGQAHIAGLLLNVSEPQIGADNWYGYEVSLNADNQTVFVGDHRHNFRLLKSAPAKIVPGQWHRLRAKWAQGQLLIFLDDADEPTIVLDDHDRLTGQLAGLRTWGSDVHFRNFTVTNHDVQHVAQWPAAAAQELPLRDTEQWIRKQALAALGRTLFNLNEFVYVE